MSVVAARTRPRPEEAINARKRESTAKIAAVEKVVKLLGRSGAPMTRAAISRLAGVSRSFTYENDDARAIIAAARRAARPARTAASRRSPPSSKHRGESGHSTPRIAPASSVARSQPSAGS